MTVNIDTLNGTFEKFVSLFDNATTTTQPQHLTIKELLNNIQSGAYAEQVNQARKLLAMEGRKSYDSYKKKSIAGVTLSAYCHHRQKTDATTKDKLIYHTGILQIDIDKIPTERLSEVKTTIQNDKHTLFCFDSLSGEGLKAGILINGNKHKESFLQAEKYYKENYGLVIDQSVKDVFRLCFVSYDAELFINPNAEPFLIQEPESKIQDSAKLQKPKNTTNSINTNDRMNKYAEQGIENARQIIIDSIPGNRHNARCRAGYLLGGYIAGGFFTKEYAMNQIESVVKSKTELPIEQAMNDIADSIEAGTSEPIIYKNLEKGRKDYLQQKHGNTWHNIQTVNQDTGEMTETSLPFVFWYENDKKELKILQTALYDFLKNNGIKRISIDTNDVRRFILVRIEHRIIFEIDIIWIRNFVKQKIESLPDQISENFTRKDLQELFLKGVSQYINSEKLSEFNLETIEFLQDTQHTAYFFFKNGFVEVTKDTIKLKSYKELSGYIWKSQIINHKFEVVTDTTKIEAFDFSRFIENICSIRLPEKKLDVERHEALICTIGYLLHNYRTTANKFAVILSEANINDEPQGRTGKGLLLQSINKLRKVTTIDGKNFSFDSQFAFQTVELDTQILFFDDVLKYFNFQRLFSAITEGLSFERKHKDRINLSAENSPKIVVSTNFSIQGKSESDKGRKYEMELLCYYNADYRPVNDFGAEFFHAWNPEQWNLFYNYMIYCEQTYFINECKLPSYSSETIDEKKLLNATNAEFIEYANELPFNKSLPVTETYTNFLEFAGLTSKEVSKIRFNKWLKDYCDFKKLKYQSQSLFTEGKTIRFHLISKDFS